MCGGGGGVWGGVWLKQRAPPPNPNPTTLLRQLSRRCQAAVLDQRWPGTGAAGRSSLRTPSPLSPLSPPACQPLGIRRSGNQPALLFSPSCDHSGFFLSFFFLCSPPSCIQRDEQLAITTSCTTN